MSSKLASSGSAVVENPTRHPKVKGLNPTPDEAPTKVSIKNDCSHCTLGRTIEQCGLNTNAGKQLS